MSEESGDEPRHTSRRVVGRHDDPPAPGRPPLQPDDVEGELAPEDLEGEIGAEGGSRSPNHQAPSPFHPTRDGTALGDTDQHSNA